MAVWITTSGTGTPMISAIVEAVVGPIYMIMTDAGTMRALDHNHAIIVPTYYSRACHVKPGIETKGPELMPKRCSDHIRYRPQRINRFQRSGRCSRGVLLKH